MGHLGLTPQSIYKFGTYKARAREKAEAEQLIKDALLLEKVGCFAIVLEKIPAELAASVSASLRIPTIGIGAGAGCEQKETGNPFAHANPRSAFLGSRFLFRACQLRPRLSLAHSFSAPTDVR